MNIKKPLLALFTAIIFSFLNLNAKEICLDADLQILDYPENFDVESLKQKQVIIVLNKDDVEKSLGISPTLKDQVLEVIQDHVLPITYIVIMAYMNVDL